MTTTTLVPFPTPKPIPARSRGGYSAVVWIDRERNYRVYLDLTKKETTWLSSIASAFDLTIEEFILGFHKGNLPRAPYPRENMHDEDRTAADYALFTITCSNPKVWRQVEALAQFYGTKNGAQGLCAGSILGSLECSNDDVLFHPRTQEVLCDEDEIRNLEYRISGVKEKEPPRDRDGYMLRGQALAIIESGKGGLS